MLTTVVPTATLTAPRPNLDVLGVPGQINLDYAATAPCARAAADAVAALLPWYGGVHRGAGALSRGARWRTSAPGRASATSSAPAPATT